MTVVLILKKGNGDITHTQGRRPCDNGGRDWTSQGRPTVAGSHLKLEEARKGSLLELSEGTCPL